MYVMSQRHIDIMMIIAIHCDSLCTNCWFLKISLVDHIGVMQTPITLVVTGCFSSYFSKIYLYMQWESQFPTLITNLNFSVSYILNFVSGCPKAVLRIYTNYSKYPTHEICGTKVKDAQGYYPPEVLSQGNFIRLRYVYSLVLNQQFFLVRFFFF